MSRILTGVNRILSLLLGPLAVATTIVILWLWVAKPLALLAVVMGVTFVMALVLSRLSR